MNSILINGRFLTEERPTGTHRSAMGFTKELIKYRNELNLRIFCNAEKLKKRRDVAWLPQEIVRHIPINGRISSHLWEQFVWPFTERSTIHLNLLNTGPFLFPTKKEILFIHDLNFWKLKGVFSPQFRAWYRMASMEAAKKARHIVCFTEYVKEDVSNILKIPRDHISVIYQGSGMSKKNYSFPQYLETSPYFLCVGSLQPHKNLAGVLKAWSLSQLYKKEFKLIIIGRRQENFQNLNLDPRLLEIPGITFTGYVTDEALATYYYHATGFLYLSFHEGFGLPIVEAFEMECPVITSNVSCLPEVAGNAALFVDPSRPEEIAERMKELSENSNLRKELISLGKERAKFFSWENAGKRLADLIQKINL